MEVEAIIISRLADMGYEAFRNVPKSRPEEFCTVMRNSGGIKDMVIDICLVSVDCWSTSDAKAASMATDVIHALVDEPIDGIYHIGVNSKYPSRDVDSGAPRCSLTLDVTARFK